MNLARTIAPGRDFVFANLHGRWSGFLRGDELRRVVQSGSPDLLTRALASRGVRIAHLGEARNELVRHLGGELARVAGLLGGGLAAFYLAFLRRFWQEDLKTLLHARVTGERSAQVYALLVDLPMLPRLPVRQMLDAANDSDALARLEEVEGAGEAVGKIAAGLLANKDIPSADAALDRDFFSALRQAADRCPWSARPLVRELVGLEIDTVNLVTLLRNRRTYQLPKEDVLSLCVPEGPGTGGKVLGALAEAQSPTAMADLLPRHLATCLRGRSFEDVAAVEDRLRELLHARARAGFRDYERPLCSTVAYPYLKWTEVVNLGRVCEGMRFGMLPTELSPLLIGEARHA